MTSFGAPWTDSGTVNKEGTRTVKKKIHLNFTGTKFRAFCLLKRRSYIARTSGCFPTKAILPSVGAIMALPNHLLMQRPQNVMITLLKTVLTRLFNGK